MLYFLRPLWSCRSLPARAVTHWAGLAVLVVVPLEAERDLFTAFAEPAIGSAVLEAMFADRTGKHGDNLHAYGTPKDWPVV